MSRAQARWLVAIIAIGAVLRVAWALFASGDPPIDWLHGGDQFAYYHYGREIAAGHGYTNFITGEPTAYHPVGYPAMLAVIFWIIEHTPLPDSYVGAAAAFHVVVSTATVALVFVIGRRLFGVTAGLVAAALLALFPNAIFQVASLQLETTFMFLAAAAIAIIVDHDWQHGLPSRDRLLAFGIVLGFSVLVRPFSVWFLLGLLLAVVATGVGWRRALTVTLVPTAVVVAMSVPWTVRNAVDMDAFVPSSTNMGDTLCLDRSPQKWTGFRFADHEWCADPQLPEVERNRENTKMALRFVREHPLTEVGKIVTRARFMFRHDNDGLEAVETLAGDDLLSDRERSFLANVADGYFFVVLGLSVLGLPQLVGGGPRAPQRRLLLVAVLSLLGVPLLLWGNPRFHLPLVPFMTVLAAAAVLAGVERWRAWRASAIAV